MTPVVSPAQKLEDDGHLTNQDSTYDLIFLKEKIDQLENQLQIQTKGQCGKGSHESSLEDHSATSKISTFSDDQSPQQTSVEKNEMGSEEIDDLESDSNSSETNAKPDTSFDDYEREKQACFDPENSEMFEVRSDTKEDLSKDKESSKLAKGSATCTQEEESFTCSYSDQENTLPCIPSI